MLKKTLKDILLEMNAVTPQQIADSEQEIKKTQQSLEEYLLEKNIISAETLAQAYATLMEVPYIETVTEEMSDPVLLARAPLKFLRDNLVMPIKLGEDVLILTSNPFQYQPVDELKLILGGEIGYAVATQKIILEGINRYYPLEGTKQMIEQLEGTEELDEEIVNFAAIDEADILGMAAEAPIIKLVNHILYQAVKQGASDVHIEPFEKEVHVRYRIDGVLYPVLMPPKRMQAALVSRIKIMAHLNIAEKRKPQDGRIQIKIADKPIDIRVSIIPVTFGERIVMRLLDKSRAFGALDTLGFSKRDLAIVNKNIEQPNGIVLVSGPTGSGKTSTLYAVLSKLNTPEVNIITVEDPVEYQMSGVAQIQVQDKIGLTFAVALRAILRQDPDIIMIGETRDSETAQIAIQAALTGHLVLSTIHTNNAPATITRLIDMGIEPFLIASSLISVIAQRLVRRLCNACKEAYKPKKDVLLHLGLTEKESEKITFYKAVGCPACNNTGYKGRLAIFEIMEITGNIARLIMDRADANVIRKQAIADGMTLLVQDGLRKIEQGLTTIEEVLSVAVAEEPGERDF
jgi:general secretion pathway protein E